MKKCVLWLWIILGFSTAWANGGLAQPWFAFDDPFSLWLDMDGMGTGRLQHLTGYSGFSSLALSLRVRPTDSLLPGLGFHGGGIDQVSITPTAPQAGDEVSVTIAGQKPYYCEVERIERRVTGGQIQVTVYWVDTRLLPVRSGIMTIEEPYEITVPLGTLDPGQYIVVLSYRGEMKSGDTAYFTVAAANGTTSP